MWRASATYCARGRAHLQKAAFLKSVFGVSGLRPAGWLLSDGIFAMEYYLREELNSIMLLLKAILDKSTGTSDILGDSGKYIYSGQEEVTIEDIGQQTARTALVSKIKDIHT